jgi:transposase-like protein
MDTELTLVDLMERFPDADSARDFLEENLWPDGPICPHCQSQAVYRLTPKPDSPKGKHCRKGLLKCKECRKQFTVTVGTIFEDSHIPLHKWLLGVYLMCSSKKGVSSHQLHRMLKIQYKSAWFMTHRIRQAMEQFPVRQMLQGKLKGTVEVDETYIGGKEKGIGSGVSRLSKKVPVVALVERGGNVRSFPVDRVTLANIGPILREHVDAQADLNTDDSAIYYSMKPDFPKHETVVHSKGEYVRHEGPRKISTNTVEGFFSLVKRGVYGTYHHWSRHHMHRYLSEFNFRYNNRGFSDGLRSLLTIRGAEGKRLTYRPMLSQKKA